MSHRIDKVESLIKEEISLIFLYKFHEPSLGLVTVTNVKVSADLRIAKIYVSVLEKEKRTAAMDLINSKNGFIRSELASRVRIKFIPELKFFLDDTLDYVEKIEDIFKKIHEEDDNKSHEVSDQL
ncbi:MAG: 30S ribosome-binding factor RbfA [Ignavibacteriaceae bacterium]|jgi:ribosome-binding factor A|nr:30S ribosome-binding factor RbfA [Ignavibacteriaceae bacterium]